MAYTRDELIQMVREIADANGIRQDVALAQINKESSFQERAVNPETGARGIAQFMPTTWAQYGTNDFNDAFDPYLSLIAWGQLMSELLSTYGGNYEMALREYYGGPDQSNWGPRTRAYASTVLANASQWSDAATELRSLDFGAPSLAPEDKSSPWLMIGLGAALLIVGFVVLKD